MNQVVKFLEEKISISPKDVYSQNKNGLKEWLEFDFVEECMKEYAELYAKRCLNQIPHSESLKIGNSIVSLDRESISNIKLPEHI